MKKIISLLCALLASALCFGFTACGGPTITVGYTEYPPMNYKDNNGKLIGFDTELAEKAFGELGYKVRFKLIDWNNKYMELDSGVVDCLWNGFTANCADPDGVQRAEKVDFSYYYMYNTQCVIRLASSTELVSSSEFVGKSVAYESGSAGDSYIAKITGDVNKKPVSSQMDAVREVNSGTAQYAVIDLLLAQSIVGENDYQNLVINESIEIETEYYAIGFKKGSELTQQINEKLLAYAQDGSLATLAQKYGLSGKIITDYTDQIN